MTAAAWRWREEGWWVAQVRTGPDLVVEPDGLHHRAADAGYHAILGRLHHEPYGLCRMSYGDMWDLGIM